MAAWVNDHLIQDCLASTKIGSNSKEWRDEEYDATRSTLYGSYVVYCQQTNRSAKSPQNFSAELLELATRILGWKAEKGKVKLGGTSVRVIKGLRLRSAKLALRDRLWMISPQWKRCWRVTARETTAGTTE